MTGLSFHTVRNLFRASSLLEELAADGVMVTYDAKSRLGWEARSDAAPEAIAFVTKKRLAVGLTRAIIALLTAPIH